VIEKLWRDDSSSARAGRAALLPLELIYRSAMAVRGELFDRDILPTHPSPIAVVSVGNITVGGTGKTPVSALIASRLAGLGRQPAIVLRGYGGDEPFVHARLNPSVPVIIDADRSAGITSAHHGGADVAVLDDGFQHRRAHRDEDVVLVSADSWSNTQRMLPAGPYREPPRALRRATVIVITSKVASAARIDQVADWVNHVAPAKPVVVARLIQYDLVRVVPPGETVNVEALAGKRVVAVAGVADPSGFFAQIEARGATVIPVPFADHHLFTDDDVTRIVGLGRGAHYTLCTLKDAVKLGPLWPASAAPLWYVSLSVEFERAEAVFDEMLRRLPQRRRQ
jgi:tetraacyldisaccharide 4'-kinase